MRGGRQAGRQRAKERKSTEVEAANSNNCFNHISFITTVVVVVLFAHVLRREYVSPPSAMHRLCADEVCCVMQMLDRIDIVRLARYSTHCMQSQCVRICTNDVFFAWKGTHVGCISLFLPCTTRYGFYYVDQPQLRKMTRACSSVRALFLHRRECESTSDIVRQVVFAFPRLRRLRVDRPSSNNRERARFTKQTHKRRNS
jgi:hypothetical protein